MGWDTDKRRQNLIESVRGLIIQGNKCKDGYFEKYSPKLSNEIRKQGETFQNHLIKLNEIIEDLNSVRFCMGIFGAVSTGKSSLIRKFFNIQDDSPIINLFPTLAGVCTATRIFYMDISNLTNIENKQEPKYYIYYIDEKELLNRLEFYTKYILDNHSLDAENSHELSSILELIHDSQGDSIPIQSNIRIIIKRIYALKSSLSILMEGRKDERNSILSALDGFELYYEADDKYYEKKEGHSVNNTELEPILKVENGDSKISVLIDRVEIYFDTKGILQKNMVVTDLPGVGDIYPLHGYLTESFIPQAKARIFTFSALAANTQDKEFSKIIAKVYKNDNTALSKAFWVLSRCDAVDEKGYNESVENVKKLWAEFDIGNGSECEKRFFKISAQRVASLYNVKYDPFEKFKEALESFLEQDIITEYLKKKEDDINSMIRNIEFLITNNEYLENKFDDCKKEIDQKVKAYYGKFISGFKEQAKNNLKFLEQEIEEIEQNLMEQLRTKATNTIAFITDIKNLDKRDISGIVHSSAKARAKSKAAIFNNLDAKINGVICINKIWVEIVEQFIFNNILKKKYSEILCQELQIDQTSGFSLDESDCEYSEFKEQLIDLTDKEKFKSYINGIFHLAAAAWDKIAEKEEDNFIRNSNIDVKDNEINNISNTVFNASPVLESNNVTKVFELINNHYRPALQEYVNSVLTNKHFPLSLAITIATGLFRDTILENIETFQITKNEHIESIQKKIREQIETPDQKVIEMESEKVALFVDMRNSCKNWRSSNKG